jgi:hypothetical protein
MSQSVPKKFKTPLSLSSPLLQFLSKLLSFSHPSLKLVSRQNRSPLASAEEIGFSPRRKSPKPDGSFFSCSLTLSLTSPAHSIVTSLISPILRGPSSHAGTAVPLSPLHHPISVPLAATGRLRDNLPQRIHRQGFFKGEEVRIVSDTCF